MASSNFLYQTLIRTTASPASSCLSATKTQRIRCFSTMPGSNSRAELTASELEARVVERVEDYIHSLIVQRSRPEWLPFVPGGSFWVPPRPSSYAISDVVHRIANAPTEEENLSTVTMRGWPSSAFFLPNEESPHSDFRTAEMSSNEASHDEEG